METADFEERQFEHAVIGELAQGTSYPLSPGQVFEALVGYDTALHVPASGHVWDLLQAGAPPGAVLTPHHWAPLSPLPPPDRLPPDLISLILQFKRPELVDHNRAGQFDHWRGPYFRFHLREGQRQRLETLEGNLGDLAVVRYAAGAFISLDDLWDYTRERTVCTHSTFVSPAALLGHTLWSYSGPGTTGFANPTGEEAESDTIQTLLDKARDRAERGGLRDHIRKLAASQEIAGIGDGQWIEQLGPPVVPLTSEAAEAAADWAAVADAVARCGATWLVLGFEPVWQKRDFF